MLFIEGEKYFWYWLIGWRRKRWRCRKTFRISFAYALKFWGWIWGWTGKWFRTTYSHSKISTSDTSQKYCQQIQYAYDIIIFFNRSINQKTLNSSAKYFILIFHVRFKDDRYTGDWRRWLFHWRILFRWRCVYDGTEKTDPWYV